MLVGEWIIYSYNARLFAKRTTCTVVVHDAGAERLNICWICFDDLVTNKTADFLNICLQLRLSNCVPRTLGVPWENSHGGRICLPCVGIYCERVRSLPTVRAVESRWNVMAHGDAREGKWRGIWRMEWVASTLHTTSEHGVSSITTADAHTSAASSRLNWRPRRF